MELSREQLRHISKSDLAKLGLNGVAYIRPMIVDNEQVFSVHAADGSQLGIVPSLKVAIIGLQEGDIQPVMLQ